MSASSVGAPPRSASGDRPGNGDGTRARTPAVPDAPPLLEGAASARTRRTERLARRLLVVADLLATAVALILLVRLADEQLPVSSLAVVPLGVAVAKSMGLYDRDRLVLSRSTLDEAPQLLKLAGLLALGVWLSGYGEAAAALSRRELLTLWLLTFVLLLGCRILARACEPWLRSPERCLVVGERRDCAHMRAKVDGSHVHASVVAELRLDGPLEDEVDERFLDVARQGGIERVLIAPPTTDAADTHRLIRLAKAAGVPVSVLPRGFEAIGSAVEFDSVDGMQLLGVRRFGLPRSARLAKRCFDLAGAGLLGAALVPVAALIAAAIKLDSSGPVFFRQTRVGRDGRRFDIYKFRSMVADAEALKASLLERNEARGLFKIADDPRITRVGRWLRRSSLDELPQLINVLRGEMSLVGPRPLVVDEDEKVVGLDRSRLHLTPGMTGDWQVLGSSRIPMQEMLGIDYLYVANWSLWNDVKILLRTVPRVVTRAGL